MALDRDLDARDDEAIDDLLALAAAACGRPGASVAFADGERRHWGDQATDPAPDGAASVPVLLGRTVVGSLAVAGSGSGSLTPAERSALLRVAGRIGAHLELRESERRSRAVLDRGSLLITTIDADGIVRSMTPALESLLGQPAGRTAGVLATRLIAPAGRHLFEGWFADVVASPGLHASHFAPIDDERYVELIATNLLADPVVGAVVVGVREVTARRNEAVASALLQAVTIAANGVDGVEAAASLVLAELGERGGWAAGGLFLADRTRRCYTTSPARWADDPDALAPFLDATTGRPIGLDTGVTGEVFRHAEPRWIEDMTTDPAILRGVLAARVGLRCMVAVPVVVDGEAVAVIEVYDRRARARDDRVLGLLSTVADQLARVAERQRAKEAIAVGEERLRRVLDTANDAFIAIDEFGIVTAWNAQAARTFGWSGDEAIGQPLEQLVVPPEQRAAHRIGLARAASTGESELLGRPIELEAITRDGDRLPVELTLWAVRDGERWAFNAFARDVSGRVARDAELRAKEARLSAAQEIARMGSWEWDIEQDVIHWSDSLYLMFGLDPDEFQASFEAYLASIHADDRAAVEVIVRRALATGEPFEVQHRTVLADGSVRHVHGRGEVILGDGGQPVRMRGIARDVTEAVQADEQLRATEARFRALTALAPTGIFLTDKDGRCTYVNERWQEITGISADGAAEGGWLTMVHPDDRADVVARWDPCIAVGAEYAQRFRVLRPDGEVRWVHAAAARLEDGGTVSGFVGTTTDVTALVEASRLKSAFLANMSHEIRTPMNAVLGFATLLLDADLEPQQRAHVTGLQTAATNLLRIIDDVLDFSKVEAGRLEIEAVPTDLRGLVRGVAAMFCSAAASGVRLDADWAPGVPSYVLADPVRLRQVLTNLVGNAVKFTAAGAVTIRLSTEGDRVRFEVDDTGIGIEPAAVAKLFRPFSQADTSTTRRFGGTGLGLAICRQLVELMGGDIGVQSEPGHGSRFWFTLPLQACEAPADDVEQVALPSQHGRVLLAEDNELNQLVARSLLEKLGFEVALVADGAGAVEAVRDGEFDAVLMDCQMPVMDGYDATREIRRLERGRRHTTVIAMTAAAMAGDRERCLSAGMDDYVAKPVAPEALLAALGRCARPVPHPARLVGAGLGDHLPPDVYRTIVATFVRSMAARVAELDRALRDGDLDAAARVAHSAKGASGTFGAMELAEVAGELEQACIRGDHEAAQRLAAAFNEESAAVEAELAPVGSGRR